MYYICGLSGHLWKSMHKDALLSTCRGRQVLSMGCLISEKTSYLEISRNLEATGFVLKYCFEIWHALRQHSCRGTCQISRRYINLIVNLTNSRLHGVLRLIRRLIGYRNRVLSSAPRHHYAHSHNRPSPSHVRTWMSSFGPQRSWWKTYGHTNLEETLLTNTVLLIA